MCAIQLHGFVPAQTPKQNMLPSHEVLSCGPISVLISQTSTPENRDDLPPEELAAWALKHNAILMGYCAHTTVVPMAIGAVFSGKQALKATLGPEMDAHVAKLKALEGIQEFTVQLTFDTTPEPARVAPTSGRHFLQLRRGRRDDRYNLDKNRKEFAQHVVDLLQTPTLQIEPARTPKPDKLINCVVLIRQHDVHHLQHIARSLDTPAKALGLDLVIAGPWPPYSGVAFKAPPPEVYDVTGA